MPCHREHDGVKVSRGVDYRANFASTGDGQIIARVNAWVSGHNNAYAGVMFRESLAANARFSEFSAMARSR